MRKDDSDRLEKWAATSSVATFALLLTLTLCGPAAVAQSAAFHANGAFADEIFCSGFPLIECIDVEVSRGTTAGQTTTFLSYDHSFMTSGGSVTQDTLGFGMIPNSAFQVHPQTALLNVDTSTVAGFVNKFCAFDPSTNLFTCNSAPGGVVTGTWTVITNLQTIEFSGTTRFTFPNVIESFTGTSKTQAAHVSVNVLGASLANVGGNVGTNHNTDIFVQVLH